MCVCVCLCIYWQVILSRLKAVPLTIVAEWLSLTVWLLRVAVFSLLFITYGSNQQNISITIADKIDNKGPASP